MVKVTRLEMLVPHKGLVTRNTHVTYQSSNPRCYRVIARLKFTTVLQKYGLTERTKTINPRLSISGAWKLFIYNEQYKIFSEENIIHRNLL